MQAPAVPGLQEALNTLHLSSYHPLAAPKRPNIADSRQFQSDVDRVVIEDPLSLASDISDTTVKLARRTSLDERRLPPVLETEVNDSNTGSHGIVASSAPGRSRSGTNASTRRCSRELLRRCSNDTTCTLDFESDPESFHFRPPSIRSQGSKRSSLQGIRVRDNSWMESVSFAKEVHIPAFHTVGNSIGGYVTYECKILTKEGTTVTRMKRYSAFCQLKDELLRAYPALYTILDTLPPKSLAKFRVSFLEKRRKRLSYWLKTVLLHPQLGASPQAKAWLLE